MSSFTFTPPGFFPPGYFPPGYQPGGGPPAYSPPPTETTSTLYLGGIGYGAAGPNTRRSLRLILNACTNNYDGTPGSLAFTENAGKLDSGPSFRCGTTARLSIVGSPYAGQLWWSGEITDIADDYVAGMGYVYRYQAKSLEYRAGTLAVTNPIDLTGTIRYNLRPTDDGYDPTLARLQVKDILQRVLDGHSSQLNSIGISGYSASDLSPLTIVPPVPVIFKGANLWVRLIDFLRDWHGKYTMYVDPTGTIRVANLWSLPAQTATVGPPGLGGIRLAPPQVRRSTESCASRVVVRGQDIREGAFLSLSGGTLTPNYTSGQASAFKYTDFSQPGGSFDVGSVTSQGPTSFVYQSDNPATTWPVNYLSTNGANCMLINPVATGITAFERRNALSNTALSAGGTATINVDYPLANTGYTRCALAMVPTAQSKTYREFRVVNTYIAQHMEQYFHFPSQWISKNQVIQTMQATGVSCWSSSGSPPYATWPMPIEVDANAGVIRAYEPIVKPWNTPSDLNAGGSNIKNVPQDVWAYVPFTVGVLTAPYPPDDSGGHPAYDGTASTVDGLNRTLYYDVPSWVWPGDRANMVALAQSIWETTCNTVVQGTATVRNLWQPALGGPFALNIASTWGTTGMEAAALPVRSVSITWPPDGATNWNTTLYLSNQRRRNTGDAYYIHPGFLQVPLGGFGSIAGQVEGQASASYGQPTEPGTTNFPGG